MNNFESICWTILEPPVSINATIQFEGNIKSSKLIRNLMNLCFNFGIGLTSPMLSQDNDELLMFGLKLIVPNNQYSKKCYRHMEKCVTTIETYLNEVEKQMDFTTLDVSMFSDYKVSDINFDSISNQRDNKYNGSWQNFIIDLTNNGKVQDIELMKKCVEFEKKNKKDIGIVSNQILNVLTMSKAGLFEFGLKN